MSIFFQSNIFARLTMYNREKIIRETKYRQSFRDVTFSISPFLLHVLLCLNHLYEVDRTKHTGHCLFNPDVDAKRSKYKECKEMQSIIFP